MHVEQLKEQSISKSEYLKFKSRNQNTSSSNPAKYLKFKSRHQNISFQIQTPEYLSSNLDSNKFR